MTLPAILLNPKVWMLASMASEAAIRKIFSEVEGKSDAELDVMILKNRVEIDA